MNKVISFALASMVAYNALGAEVGGHAEIGDSPLVVQVIGAPASGKSVALQRIEKHFNQDIREITKSLRDVDLDLIRATFNNLDGNTKFYVIVRALDLYRRIGLFNITKHNSKKYAWQSEEAANLLKMFKPGEKIYNAFKEKLDIEIAYDIEKGLMVNGKTVKQDELSRLYNIDVVFEDFDNVTLGNIINRYDVLVAVMENALLRDGIRLDNVGSTSGDIVKRLKFLRDNDYAALSIVVHPKTPLVNLLLNSLRGADGKHYPPSSMIIKKYYAIEKILGEYTGASEYTIKVTDFENEKEIQEIKEWTQKMTTKDNALHADKSMDLILIDNSQGLEKVIKEAIDTRPSETQQTKCYALWIASIADIYGQRSDLEVGQFMKDVQESNEVLKQMRSITSKGVIDIVSNLARTSIDVAKVFGDTDKLKRLIVDLYEFCGVEVTQ